MEQQYERPVETGDEIVRQLRALRTAVIVGMTILILAVLPWAMIGAGVVYDWAYGGD